MTHGTLHSSEISASPGKLIYCPDLPQAVRTDVLRQPKCLCSSPHICPNGLPGPVLREVSGPGKYPDLTGLLLQLLQQLRLQVDPASLLSLLLRDPELRLKLIGPKGQSIPNPEAG